MGNFSDTYKHSFHRMQSPQHPKYSVTTGRRITGSTHVGVGEHVSSLSSAVARTSLLWPRGLWSRSPTSVRLHGDFPHQAAMADSATTHQTPKSVASLLHISEQFLERSRFSIHTNHPPLHPNTHWCILSPTPKCQACQHPQQVVLLHPAWESWVAGKLRRGHLTLTQPRHSAKQMQQRAWTTLTLRWFTN